MGRAMLIICLGVLVALGYTFIGSANQHEGLIQRNVNSYYAMKARNTAFTGVQLAIQKYNEDPTKSEFTNTSAAIEDANLTLSIKEIPYENADSLRVTSVSSVHGAEHRIVATYDIREKLQLVPDFVSALSIATDNFTFDINGNSAQLNGTYPDPDVCPSKSGVAVKSEDAKEYVGQYSAITGTSGNEASVNSNLESEFTKAEDLIEMLEDQPDVQYLKGDQQVTEMGTKENPGIFFIEEDVKLAGGIEEGFGIMVVRSNADFDYEGGLEVNGNFTFNGLVIFQNASEFDAAGTPNINGTVLIGNSEGEGFYPTNISIKGDVTVQYDCTAKKYAELAVNNTLNTTIYKLLSVYE